MDKREKIPRLNWEVYYFKSTGGQKKARELSFERPVWPEMFFRHDTPPDVGWKGNPSSFVAFV